MRPINNSKTTLLKTTIRSCTGVLYTSNLIKITIRRVGYKNNVMEPIADQVCAE